MEDRKGILRRRVSKWAYRGLILWTRRQKMCIDVVGRKKLYYIDVRVYQAAACQGPDNASVVHPMVQIFVWGYLRY